MTSHDFRLAAARPANTQPDTAFTEAVMRRVVTPKKQSRFITLLRRSPAVTLLIIALAITLISGTTYAAVTYLWPQTRTSMMTTTDATGRKTYAISSENCDFNGKFQLKKNPTLTDSQVKEVMDAECEYFSIYQWGYHDGSTIVDHTTPNHVTKNVSFTTTLDPRKLVAVTDSTITTTGLNNDDRSTQKITDNTQIIINRQAAKVGALKPGDIVALVTNETFDVKNSADCSPASCTSNEINKVTTLNAVARLSYQPVHYEQLRSDFVAIGECRNNPSDTCPSAETTSIFMRNGFDIFTATPQWQETLGTLQSYDDNTLVIKTRSNRQVTVHTDPSLIAYFNGNGNRNNGFHIELGDTLDIRYLTDANSPPPTIIPSVNVMLIELVTESNDMHVKY